MAQPKFINGLDRADPDVFLTTHNYSFLEMADSAWVSDRPKWVFHRLCTLMRKMGAASVAIEDVEAGHFRFDAVNLEREAISKRLGVEVTSVAKQYTFFAVPLASKDLYEQPDGDNVPFPILGYCIVTNVSIGKLCETSHILECVTRPVGVFSKHASISDFTKWQWEELHCCFLHARRMFQGKVFGKPFQIEGSYFCQQNQITTVCGQVCAAMMINNCPNGPLVTPEQINQSLYIDHADRKLILTKASWATRFGNHNAIRAVTDNEVFTVLKHFGYKTEDRRFSVWNQRELREFIYGFIESSFPAMVAFQSRGSRVLNHVVAVVGHTLDSHSWLPATAVAYPRKWEIHKTIKDADDNRPLSSVDWVDDFIIHDDEFGMQLTVPANSFTPDSDRILDKGDSEQLIAAGIFPDSDRVRILSLTAEMIAAYCVRSFAEKDPSFFESSYYLKRIRDLANSASRTDVYRSILVTPEQYLKHIQAPDWRGFGINSKHLNQISEILKSFSKLWLVEVTDPNLYVGNKTKVMDVLIDPSCSEELLRQSYGHAIVGIRRSHFAEFRARGQDGWVRFGDLGTQVHFPLFKMEDIEVSRRV